MSFRYIGSKVRVAAPIAVTIGDLLPGHDRFVDAFAGTGAVAAGMADMNVPIVVNDTLHAAVTMSLARLTAASDVSFARLGGYEATLAVLNDLPGVEGYLHRTYSPGSLEAIGFERRYFTGRNAARVDAMRIKIAEWRNEDVLSDREQTLLLADLISAANRIANIAGTYGCFLSKWQSSALDDLRLRPRDLLTRQVAVKGVVGDVHDLDMRANDLVYFDPPYTKRQYASYYHILETIVLGDEPVVEGVSGLRPWKDKASPFCYKRKALAALVSLISTCPARTTMLSYSCEGHVDLDELVVGLSKTGTVSVAPIDRIGRYRPNKTASANGDSVTEYVLIYHPEEMVRMSFLEAAE